MGAVVRLTVVGTQGEADVLCSKLRAFGIRCADRDAVEGLSAPGGWRDVFVDEDDLPAARELLTPAD